jgi:hypothetical protein
MSRRMRHRGGKTMQNTSRPVTFSAGMLVGGLGGFLLGALLGKQFIHVLSVLVNTVDRRSSDDERLRFELLSQ